MDDRYYVKIVPQKGDRVHRFVVHRRHVRALCIGVGLCLFSVLAFTAVEVIHAQQERATVARIAGETEALHRQLQQVQRENQQITQLIGAPPTHHAKKKTSWVAMPANLAGVEQRVTLLAAASQTTSSESARIRGLVLRVLNLRHLRDLALARLIAFIPSIDPVDGGVVVGCFCYRYSPSVEFHEGVDLNADYGETVHAAAAGTIAAAGWDGGYGMKVDIDHGNGYHTWYAHLSRIDVHVGDRVYKGETIAAAGATGFATGPHLHYQVMYDGQPIDPTPFLRGVPHAVLAALR
ncbi:MAG TPA: peptidoglycan DD-metalloendopeptidase family protein [Candidatus Tyrphobacter sp.]